MRKIFNAVAAGTLVALTAGLAIALPHAASIPVDSDNRSVPPACQLSASSTNAQRRDCLETEWNKYIALQTAIDVPRGEKRAKVVNDMKEAILKADRDIRQQLKDRKITQEEFDAAEQEIEWDALTAGLALSLDTNEGGSGCANIYNVVNSVTVGFLKREYGPVTDYVLGNLFNKSGVPKCFGGIIEDKDASPEQVAMAKEAQVETLQLGQAAEARWCGLLNGHPDDPAVNKVFEDRPPEFRQQEIESCRARLDPVPKF
jgi:hypothetical protein